MPVEWLQVSSNLSVAVIGISLDCRLESITTLLRTRELPSSMAAQEQKQVGKLIEGRNQGSVLICKPIVPIFQDQSLLAHYVAVDQTGQPPVQLG